MCYYEAKQTINDIFYLQKGKKMKQNRVEAVLKYGIPESVTDSDYRPTSYFLSDRTHDKTI